MLNKLYVDLKAIVYNARQIKKKLKKGVKFCAVVKADAYGHGAEKVANALYRYCDCYSVATVEEGVKLRLSGIDKEILVFILCDKLDIKTSLEYNLTATLTSLEALKTANKLAKEYGKILNAHVKFNTGMNRQGVDTLDELENMMRYANKNSHVKITGLYSHYACPENKKALDSATDKFLLAINIVKRYNNNATCHISASGGFLQNSQFDMVRIGLLLYGYKPFDSSFINVKRAMRLNVPVLTLRTIDKFSSALYGKCKVYKKTDITLIRFGYADGLFRKKIKGQFNNRCMDLTAVNGNFLRKKTFTVLDDANILAKKYGTIPYEILTSLGSRAEKIYIN